MKKKLYLWGVEPNYLKNNFSIYKTNYILKFTFN